MKDCIIHTLVKYTTMYEYGWVDGWNACRTTEPDKRVFMTHNRKK